MLDFMRKRTQSLLIKVIFAIIVLVFIFWGFGNPTGQQGVAEGVATVDGQIISQREFQRSYDNIKAVYRDAYKDRLTPELIQSLNLKQQTLDQLINSKLLQQEAYRIGFRVDDEELRESIRQLPLFQVDGQFSQAQYSRVLNFLRMTPSEFEEGQRGDLLQKKLYRMITEAVPKNEQQAKDLFQLANERVNLSFVKIASADLIAETRVTPQEVETYYNTHRESFRQPERVRLTYVAYPATQFEDNVQVSPQEEEDFYNSHKADRFTTPARVHARHILFAFDQGASDEDKEKLKNTATEILTRAHANEDFATLAKTYSQDPATAPNGGDLGFFPRGRMVKQFEEAAFNLSAGAISDLVETPFGYHIIKVEAAEPERTRPLDDVRSEIHKELTTRRAQELAREHAQADWDKVHSGTALEEVARTGGLTLGETPLVSRDESIPNLGRHPELIHAALGLEVNQISAPIQSENTWYLVAPREKVEARIPELAEVREDVEKRAQSEKAEQLAKTKAEAILKKLQETKSFATVAEEEHLTVEETGAFQRHGGYIPKMGNLPDLKKEAFQVTPEAPVIGQVYVWGGNAFVAMLKEKIPANMADFQKQKDRLSEDLYKRKQAAAFEEFINMLKKRADISPNLSALLNIPT
ncbi:MAG: SurA N-terminal domain-containing protein [Candidatus Binatia bacterium]